MISEELLSEILNTKVLCFKYIKDDDRKFRKEVFLIADNEGIYDLSPEELAYKGKQWAYNKGYDIASSGVFSKVYLANGFGIFDNEIKILSSNSEFEAIFRACQWILDNK